MSINVLIPSPTGEIDHNDVRLKINEIIDGGSNTPVGTVLFVHKNGSDSDSGLTIALPLQTIGAAITKAIALTPTEINQITIKVIDTGTYVESPNLPEWIHIDASDAALDGRLTSSDNTIVSFRRLQNNTIGQPCVRKIAGTGFAKVAVELLIVADAAQEGLLVDMGVMHIDVGVLSVDAGVGIKAKNGSRVSFIISEVQLLNGGLGIGTRTSGGAANFFSGNVLYAKDDGTGILLEAKVSGDIINIQAGSLIVNTLYDMGANTTLNVFATEAAGNVVADVLAIVNSTIAGDADPGTKDLSFGFEDVTVYSTRGTPVQQNWTEQLLATITVQQDVVFGLPKDVYDYVALGGGVGLNTAVTIDDVQDLIDFGAEFGGVMKGLITGTYQTVPTYSNFSFDVQSSLNPLGDPQGYRMIIFLQEIGGVYNILIDADAGDINHLTTIPVGDWVDVRLKVIANPSAITLTDIRANLIVNGEVVLTDLNIFQGQGASTRTGCFHQVWLVGQQIRLSDFGIVIYTDSSTMTIENSDMEGFKNTVITVPKGTRDYIIQFAADIQGKSIGDHFEVTALNIGGLITLTNLASPPIVLMNGLGALQVRTSSVSTVVGVNTEEDGNVWAITLPSFHTVRGFTFFEPSADSIGFGVDSDDGTGAKVQVLGGLSIDGVLVPKPEFFEIHDTIVLLEGAAKIEVEAGTGVITITLPPNPTDGQELQFYSSGDVANNNIHFISGTAATVDGEAIRVFNRDGALCTFVFLHDNWEVFHEHGRAVGTDTFFVSTGFSNQPLAIHDGTTGTETTIDFGTASDDIFDIVAGEITVLVDINEAQVITEIHVDKTVGGTDSVYSSWVEISSDGGTNWTPFPNSLRVEVMAKDGESIFISEMSLGDPLAAGSMFRVVATNTGAAAISVLPPGNLVTGNGNVSGFAAKVSIRSA